MTEPKLKPWRPYTASQERVRTVVLDYRARMPSRRLIGTASGSTSRSHIDRVIGKLKARGEIPA